VRAINQALGGRDGSTQAWKTIASMAAILAATFGFLLFAHAIFHDHDAGTYSAGHEAGYQECRDEEGLLLTRDVGTFLRGFGTALEDAADEDLTGDSD